MNVTMLTGCRSDARHSAMARGLIVAAAAMLGGCIQVTAPEKPIQINLNVTIRQEVVVSLRDDVKNLDKQFPGVF
jgi:hypothetical protein